MTRFQQSLQALGQARQLIAVRRSQGDLARIADLVDSFLDTPQMEACLARFRALPGGAELLDSRYPPLQPDLDQLLALPEGSLGHTYAALIRRLNYDPAFFRPGRSIPKAAGSPSGSPPPMTCTMWSAASAPQRPGRTGCWRSPPPRSAFPPT